jgi:hypothetical protein
MLVTLKYPRRERIVHESTRFFPTDQTRVPEDIDVMGDVDQRCAKQMGNLSNVACSFAQNAEDLQALWRCQGV